MLFNSGPGLEQLPVMPLNEPTRRERLEAETELFGFAVSGQGNSETRWVLA